MENRGSSVVSKGAGVHSAIAILLLAAIYFAAAKLGLSLAFAAEQVSLVWPPSGLALAAILLYGSRLWPGILLGAFLANVTAEEPLATACGIAVGNTLEALAAAWMLRHWAAFRTSLERPKDALALVLLAAGLSTTVSATVGVTSLCLGGVHPWSAYSSLWSVWWLGDATGDLLLTPFLLLWATTSYQWSSRRVVEGVCLLGGVAIVSLLIFGESSAAWRERYSLKYAVFPFVIWAALRFGQHGTTTVTLLASGLAIFGTLQEIGSLGPAPAHERLLMVQLFMGVVAVTALLLGAALTERRRNAERVALLHDVTRILGESVAVAEAAPKIIQLICDSLAWQLGAIWRVDAETNALRCVGLWHNGPLRFPKFEAVTRQHVFESGIGLPGRVWQSGVPAWIPDVVADVNFPRAPVAAQEGLHAAFGFPVRLGDEVVGVIEFFSPQIRRPDTDVLQMMATVGSQIGQFIDRKRTESHVRQSEARKTAILESALDAIITMDHEGKVVEFNPAAEQIFGHSRDEVLGKPMADFIIPPAYRQQHRRGLERYLATGEGSILGKRVELPAWRADGTEFPAELAITRIPCDGPPVFTGYLRDITQRKRDEQQLRDADRRKDEFLAILSHELRNPLAPIHNGLELLKIVATSEKDVRDVQEMLQRQVEQMTRLVDDLLDVSRITRGKVRLRTKPINLATVIMRAVETSRPLIDSRHQHLEVSLPAELLVIEADTTRLAQVFSNLLNNAAKYTPQGGHIWLTATREQTEAVVRVRDTGVGISPELLPRVFDMFAQADCSLERSNAGLGLGLTLVHGLVEMHGGRVQAVSEGVGKGTELIVALPLVSSQSPCSDTETGVPEHSRSQASRQVLVVDDNRDAAASLSLLLQLQGHEVRQAYDGPSAVQMAMEYRPEVVILDIGLPGMDGYGVARQLRSLEGFGEVLMVAVTGYGQDADKQRSSDAGFNAHLVKPAEVEVLRSLFAQFNGPMV